MCCQQQHQVYRKDVDEPIFLGISCSPYQTVAGFAAIVFFSNSKVVFRLTFFSHYFYFSFSLTHSVSILICLLLHNLPHLLSHLPFIRLPHRPLSCLEVAPVVFFSGWWRVVEGGGWRWVEGKKGPVKQREVVCRRGRQETQVSQDSPPVTAPWLSCRPTPDWTWQPRWATAARLLFVPLLPLFVFLSITLILLIIF